MTKIPKTLGGVPKVLYTYDAANGDCHALVIHNDLSTVPNQGYMKPAMIHPRTPEAVRTMLFNEMANRVRVRQYARLTFAKRVILHRMQDGSVFLEVRLTDEGREYLEQYHSEYGMYSYYEHYNRYDPEALNSRRLFTRFSDAVKLVLNYLGMSPQR